MPASCQCPRERSAALKLEGLLHCRDGNPQWIRPEMGTIVYLQQDPPSWQPSLRRWQRPARASARIRRIPAQGVDRLPTLLVGSEAHGSERPSLQSHLCPMVTSRPGRSIRATRPSSKDRAWPISSLPTPISQMTRCGASLTGHLPRFRRWTPR